MKGPVAAMKVKDSAKSKQAGDLIASELVHLNPGRLKGDELVRTDSGEYWILESAPQYSSPIGWWATARPCLEDQTMGEKEKIGLSGAYTIQEMNLAKLKILEGGLRRVN